MIFRKIERFFGQNWAAFLILIVATFLRLYRLEELITFGGDQGIDLLVVKRMIVEHRWTLLGPKTSVFPIYNGPIYYYMILPVLYFTKLNPASVSYFMVFLWLGAIFLVYYLGKEFWSRKAGILAAFFFSVWPVSIEYSRVSFNSFPTPFFASLFLYGLWSFLNLYRVDLHRNHGFTMPQGWNYIGVKKASEIIAANAGENFNVAAVLDGDTRAHPYRYIIETKGKMPMDVEEYPEAKILYVLARGEENFVLNYPVWEIQSFLPAEVEKIWEVQNGIKVFKLVKRKK